jgi:hypothetical protein
MDLMLPSTLKRMVAFAFAISFVVMLPWASRRLLVIGGKSQNLGASTRYQLKPVMRGLLSIGGLLGIVEVRSGIEHSLQKDSLWGPLYIGIGAICLAALVMITSEITLDEVGIHFRMFLYAETLIEWDDLSHFERFYNGRAVTTTLYIRGKSGRTIGAGDTSFDTVGLLREINSRHLLHEEPYRRRHWYGG